MAQLVEHNLAKVGVAGSSPVVRSKRNSPTTTVAGLFLYLSPRLEPERGRAFWGVAVALFAANARFGRIIVGI